MPASFGAAQRPEALGAVAIHRGERDVGLVYGVQVCWVLLGERALHIRVRRLVLVVLRLVDRDDVAARLMHPCDAQHTVDGLWAQRGRRS